MHRGSPSACSTSRAVRWASWSACRAAGGRRGDLAESGRPIFFTQVRVGRGRLFTIVKFRMMIPTPTGGPRYAQPGDLASRASDDGCGDPPRRAAQVWNTCAAT
jgi:hypothetical protein